jgi:hypothetical protein
MARRNCLWCFVDFSKAFNLLNRNILMAKVHVLLGQRLIGNMLANISVRINDNHHMHRDPANKWRLTGRPTEPIAVQPRNS